MRKIKEQYYISIFFLLASLLFGQMIRIPIFGKIILVSDIAVIIFLIFFFYHHTLTHHPEKVLNLRRGRQRILIEILTNFKKHYLFLPIICFIFFSILSLVFAIPSLGLAKVLTAGLYLFRWILYASVVFVIASLPDKEKARRTIFWGIVGIGFLLSIAGFIQLKIHPDFADMVKFGWDPHKNRLLSTWFDPNLLAGYFIIALAFLSANLMLILQKSFLRNKDTRHLGGYLVSCAIIYLAFILTYSRSGYLALFIVFATICALNFNWKFFIAGLIIAPLTLAIFPRSYSRISDAAQVDVTSQMRIDSWQDGWNVIKNNPVFGVGFNALQWQRGKESADHASSGFDSSLLTIWAATGIFGLLSYLWIIWTILKKKYQDFNNCEQCNPMLKHQKPALKSGRNNEKYFAIGSIAAIIGLLIHSCFVNSLLYPHILLAFWMITI